MWTVAGGKNTAISTSNVGDKVMYIYPDENKQEITVVYLGPHLPTKKFLNNCMQSCVRDKLCMVADVMAMFHIEEDGVLEKHSVQRKI